MNEIITEIEKHFKNKQDPVEIIGEFTTENGPSDDHFFALVFRSGGWATYPLIGGDKIEELLSRITGHTISFSLYGCVKLNSRVAWPRLLIGHALFSFDASKSSAVRLMQRLKHFGALPLTMTLTNEVKLFLQENRKIP